MLYKKKTENEAGIVNMRHMHNNRHLKQILQTRGALNKKSRYIWGMVHAHWLIWVQTSLCFIKKWLNKGQKTAKRGVYRDAWKNHLNRDISRTNQLREKIKIPWWSSRPCGTFDMLHDHIEPFFKIDLFWPLTSVLTPYLQVDFWKQLVFKAKWPNEQDGMVRNQMCGGAKMPTRLA